MSGFVFFTDVICYCVAGFQVNKSLSLVLTTYNNFDSIDVGPLTLAGNETLRCRLLPDIPTLEMTQVILLSYRKILAVRVEETWVRLCLQKKEWTRRIAES